MLLNFLFVFQSIKISNFEFIEKEYFSKKYKNEEQIQIPDKHLKPFFQKILTAFSFYFHRDLISVNFLTYKKLSIFIIYT